MRKRKKRALGVKGKGMRCEEGERRAPGVCEEGDKGNLVRKGKKAPGVRKGKQKQQGVRKGKEGHLV